MAKTKKTDITTATTATPTPETTAPAETPSATAEEATPTPSDAERVMAADPVADPEAAVDPEVMLAKLAMLEADTGQETEPARVAALCAQAGWAVSEYRAEVQRSRVRVIARRDAAGHAEAVSARDAARAALTKAQNARAAALAGHDQIIAAAETDLARAESRFRETSAAHERLKNTAPLFLKRRATQAKRDLAAATGRLDALLVRLKDETAARADAQKRVHDADAVIEELKDNAPADTLAERRAMLETLKQHDGRVHELKNELAAAKAAAEQARATMDEADAQLTGGV